MATLLESGAVKIPVKCDKCPLNFSGQETLNIHLKNCLGSEMSKTNIPHNCPLCNRDFRTFSNLLKHDETKKHLEMLDWYHNNYAEPTSYDQTETKIISLNDKIAKKLGSLEEGKEFTNEIISNINDNLNVITGFDDNDNDNFASLDDDDNNNDTDDFLSSLGNEREENQRLEIERLERQKQEESFQTFNSSPEDVLEVQDFLSQFKSSRQKDIQNITYYNHPNFRETINEDNFNNTFDNLKKVEDESFDNFLSSLQKERTTNDNNPIIEKKNNIINHIENVSNEIGFDSSSDIMDEINKAREQIQNEEISRTEKIRELEAGREPDLIEQVNNYFQRQKEAHDTIEKRGIIFSHVATTSGTVENPDAMSKNKKKVDLESKFKHHPLWNLLVRLVQEKTIAGRFSNILITCGLLDLPVIYYFVRFSSHLKGKKERTIKIQLVKILLEFETVLVQSYQKKQMIVAGKDVPKMLILFKTWNLSTLLKKLTSD